MKRSLFTLLFFTTLLPLSAEASLFKYCASHLLGTPEVHAVIPPVVSEDERALVENFISSDYFYEQFLNEQFEDSIPDGSIKSPSWELLDRIALNLVYRIENKMTENLIQYMRFVIREAVVGPMLEEYSRVLGNRKGSHTITKILSTPFLGRGFDVLTSPPLRPLAQYRKARRPRPDYRRGKSGVASNLVVLGIMFPKMNSDHLLTSLADKSTYEVEAFANENSNRILQISLEAANMDLRFVKEVSDLHERVSAQIRDNLSSGQLVASVGELTPLYTKINQALLILNNLKARFEADYTSLTAVVTKAKAMSEIDSSEKREWQMVASHASTLAANSANTGLLLESRATDLLDLKGRLQALQVSITQKIQATATR